MVRTGDALDPALVARALEVYRKHGMAAAARETGMAKTSIKRHAIKAGIDPTAATAAATANTNAAVEASAAARKLRTEQYRAGLVDKVLALAHASADAELAAIAAMRAAQNAIRDGQVIDGKDRQRLALLDSLPLRDLTNARTKAVHDVQLLVGEDTERGGAAGGVSVVFVQQPPRVGDQRPSIVQLEAPPDRPRLALPPR